ncbi:class I SAM-dependent methyltransferase [Bacillus sp. SM2101]|uniref:class I SAM-dependent methyltransferase n=1 Tax=Bacillus sp. SM2101 TaxID=2805366 RepID=UPI001BDE2B22|nr:class I SAM-dependent methyltransferase [Bacillus sp. SM2101]
MKCTWSLSEYEDPKMYDLENNKYYELPLLFSWAKKLNIKEQTIIDLACGTGRITIPFAEEGYQLLGIDIHEGMLHEAREKTTKNLSVKWIKQDCLNFKIKTKSPFIYMVGYAFQHFLTNDHQDQLFKSVHQSLSDDGIFIFNTRFPSVQMLTQPTTKQCWRTFIDRKKRRCNIYTEIRFNPVSQIQYLRITREFLTNNIIEEERISTIDLRYTYPQELERALQMNGFKLLHMYNGWDRKILASECSTIVVICQKA